VTLCALHLVFLFYFRRSLVLVRFVVTAKSMCVKERERRKTFFPLSTRDDEVFCFTLSKIKICTRERERNQGKRERERERERARINCNRMNVKRKNKEETGGALGRENSDSDSHKFYIFID
jgi:hypothetical protein